MPLTEYKRDLLFYVKHHRTILALDRSYVSFERVIIRFVISLRLIHATLSIVPVIFCLCFMYFLYIIQSDSMAIWKARADGIMIDRGTLSTTRTRFDRYFRIVEGGRSSSEKRGHCGGQARPFSALMTSCRRTHRLVFLKGIRNDYCLLSWFCLHEDEKLYSRANETEVLRHKRPTMQLPPCACEGSARFEPDPLLTLQ